MLTFILATGTFAVFAHEIDWLATPAMRVSPRLSRSMLGASGHISKWSMADVFLIGVFIAFLAANSIDQSKDVLQVQATLGTGFYYFLGYCLLSILSSQFLTPGSVVAEEREIVEGGI